MFYRAWHAYGEFSNFYMAEVHIDGKTWPSTEHYYQASKFPTDPEYQEKMRTTPKCGSVFRLGKRRQGFHPDWEKVKDDVMFKALKVKFSPDHHPELCEKLLSTGDAQLVEHVKRDRYWGDGGDMGTGKVGKNMLGKLLMKVRDEILKPKMTS